MSAHPHPDRETRLDDDERAFQQWRAAEWRRASPGRRLADDWHDLQETVAELPSALARPFRPRVRSGAVFCGRWALALALASIFLWKFALPPLAAIVLGVIALADWQTARDGSRWTAVLAICLGVFYALAAAGFWATVR